MFLEKKATSKLQEYARLYFLKKRERESLLGTHEESEIHEIRKIDAVSLACHGVHGYWVKHERGDPRFNRRNVCICVFKHCERFSYGTPLDYFRIALKWSWNDGQVCEVAPRAGLDGHGDLCELLEKWR